MGAAMSETALRLGWTPTEALADQVSGKPGPGEVGTPGGQLVDADRALQPFERQCDLPSHPVERSPGRRDSPRRRDQIIGGDQRHQVGLAALLPVLMDDAQAAPIGLGVGLRQHDHPGTDAGSLAREFLDDDVPFKQAPRR